MAINLGRFVAYFHRLLTITHEKPFSHYIRETYQRLLRDYLGMNIAWKIRT